MKLINFVKGMRASSPSLSKKNENAKRGTGSSSEEQDNSSKAQFSNFKLRVFDSKNENSPEVVELKKTKSEKIKSEGMLQSPNLNHRKNTDFAEILEEINQDDNQMKNSDRPHSRDLNIIDEDDDENELTAEIDRNKLSLLTKDFSMTRKERAATFKPFNYIKDQSESNEKDNVLKNMKNEINKEEK